MFVKENPDRKKNKNKNSFIFHVNPEDIYEDLARDVERRFDTSNYEVKRSLPIGKNKKVIGLMQNELSRKIHEVALTATSWMKVMLARKQRAQRVLSNRK